MSHSKGLLITLEGGEGAGKTTLLTALKRSIEEKGRKVFVSREPGSTVLGEKVRSLLLDKESKICSRAELLLFLAARAQNIEENILPALESGCIVLCDRFHGSSIAYQGVARGLGEEKVKELSLWSALDLEADYTFFLDIDPKIGMERSSKRSLADRMEQESLTFHQNVRDAFLRQQEVGKTLLIDASLSQQEVENIALQELDRFFLNV